MRSDSEGRVLVLLPTERDGARVARLLGGAGLPFLACEDVHQLCREVSLGAGTALLAEEAVEGYLGACLRIALEDQPPWSDFPLVILAREGGVEAPPLDTLNATLVDLPVKDRTLLSVVRAALRSRRHQYEVRDHMARRRLAGESQAYLVTLADTLRPLSDPEEVKAAASRVLGEHLGASRVAYFEVSGPDYLVERDYAAGVESLAGRHRVESFGEPLLANFRAGRTVVEVDATALPGRPGPERAAFAALQIRGHVDVPLVKGGTFVGGMTVHCREARDWTAEEVALVEQTAERTWAAVERARAERDLRAGQERFRSLFESMDEGYCVIEPVFGPDGRPVDYRYVMANAALESHTGLRDVVGKTARELMPAHESHWIEAYARVATTGERIRETGWVEDLRRWYEVSAFPVGRGQVGVLFADVTARREAEDELRDIRSRMEAALAAGAIGTWSWDISNDRFHGDGSLARIFGVPHSAVAGGPIAGLMGAIHPDDRERVGELVNRSVETGGRYEADYRVTDGAGGWRWVNARGQVERDGEGKPVRFPGVVIEVSDRKRAEEALDRVTAESERRTRLYEAVLSTTPDLAYVWGLDHRFTYANEGLLRLWGKTWDEAIGKNCLELGYESWHAAMHDREIEEVRSTRKPLRGEVPFSGTYGRRIYDYLLVPVIGADGEVEAVAGITRDVTDRKELEQELRDQDRKKDDFIALLAHELRNPLAPIRNGLNVLRLAGDDHEAVKDTREIMQRQINHMVRLIDDLLDVSRINRNKMELRVSRVTLAEAVSNAVETARPLIDAGQHALAIALPDRPVYLDADLTRLAQVFSNLLTNSAKYTPPGGRIRLSAEREDGQVSVSVSDNGIGIPSQSLEHIFDMFSQVDRDIERATGGLGIGLALVKGLVEMHAGTVSATSEGEGKGSTFTVTLPVVATSSERSPAPTANGRVGGGRRILVVDDSRDGANTLARMLRLMGNEVRTANDGLEGVEAAGEFLPDVVLMDVGMPLLNGLDATRRIREQRWGREMTIIALTGWGQDGDKERSRAAGCDGHLVKPVDIDELDRLLSRRHP